ncbi:SDR family NAD(P)-dependent oxidoreductase [Streptomyces sp. NPDC018045]|uniref:SDR family NAD(P)-dependent oxidoreductase n=1 Tax=Streptomyces sp. NPDC018045 TaxID=3365037 RepID=UPI0037BDDDD3
MQDAYGEQEFGCDVAIVGMAGRFPGAPDLDRFWRNLCDGKESVSFFDDAELAAAGVSREEFSRPDYVKAGARTEGIDLFDAEFFGYTPREATIMDPQHRVFLETVWEALEHAGYRPGGVEGGVGVFGGAGTSAYLPQVFANLEGGAAIGASNVGIGNELGFLTTRVSYKLDLRGPSVPVHTACSSSLVAVHLACQSLLNHECGAAIAGGVAFKVPPLRGYRYQESGIMSPDGHCRPFDAAGEGTVFNNGVGAVVLKRLADALAAHDTIHAVIKGTAVNNDGSGKASFTAPGVAGQSAVVLEALGVADVAADSISYVEAHGSGTKIGDSIEVEALTRAFRQSTDRTNYCALGSVKSNLGHLDAAAGIAGLLKTALALRHGTLPPTVHYTEPNADIDFARTPFRVQGELTPWERPDGPRRAGVSAFGFGGTNAHVVLEEAPVPGAPAPARPSQVLVLSARTPQALDRVTDRLAAHLRDDRRPLADTAFTLALGRAEFRHRRTVVAPTAADAAAALLARDPALVSTGEAAAAPPSVAMLFTGQGSQYAAMADELYAGEPVFRAAVDRCAAVLTAELDRDVRDLLVHGAGDEEAERLLARTEYAQPALFTLEYALARLWNAWGITPGAMIGHSLGEYVAACLAGVFTLDDALRLVSLRGRLMQRQAPGAMLSVVADRATAEALLTDGLSLAAHNGPADCVVAGTAEAVARYADAAARQGIAARPVPTTHAFHSALMRPVVEPFTEAVAAVPRGEPTLPYVSNVTGTWITAEQATDPAYWGRHLLSPVAFADGIATVAQEPDVAFLEVGPGQTLRSLVTRCLPDGDPRTVAASLPHPRSGRGKLASAQRALGLLWQAGVTPDWAAYHSNETPRRVPLPTYPFERKRYWLEAAPASPAARPAAPGPHPLLDELLVQTVDEVVFRTEFDLERHWVLSEHKMLSEAIVPGTTYLEMARAAGSVLLGAPVTAVTGTEFQVPLLVTADRPRTAHTIVRQAAGGAEFKVVSHDPAAPAGQQWTLHVRGSLTADAQPARPPEDVARLLSRCGLKSVDAAALQAAHHVMDFGSRWQGSLRTVDVGVRCAAGRLELPAAYAAETGTYPLHPALLDQATGFHQWAMFDGEQDGEQGGEQGGDGTGGGTGAGFYLPLAYDRLVVHAPLPARCLSFVRPTDGFRQSAEIRKTDVLVCAMDGTVVLEIEGFTAKRVNSPRHTLRNARAAAVHHTLAWVPAAPGGDRPREVRQALVVGTQSALRDTTAARLRDAGVQVGTAAPDTDWTGHALPADIVYVAEGTGGGTYDLPAQQRLLDSGVMGLLRLARELGQRGADARRITVVAPYVNSVTGDEPYLVPAHSALFGLAKVIGQEHHQIRCRCVDVADDVPPQTLVAEILSGDPLGQVALRAQRRYAAELVAAELLAAEPDTTEPDTTEMDDAPAEDGVHLITGGLGGLGLEIARSVGARRPGARIALVGRRAVPPRDQWPAILRDGPDRQAAQVRVLQELAERGAHVVCHQGDVADAADMARVVAAVRDDLGRITRVVHAAGTAGDGFLLRKPDEVFAATLAPKVTGALVLDTVTADDPPEMILFSSTTALFGAAGQSDYTAANLHLDGFAAWRARRGPRTVTVNWTDWLGTGMAADHGVRQDQGFFRSVGIEDGIASYEAITRSPHTQVIVGEINYAMLGTLDPEALRARMATAPLLLSDPIRRTVAARSAAAGGTRSAGPATPTAVTLLGRPGDDYTDLERDLGRLWAAEFGLDEIDVSAGLFDLGGDSLLALRLANSLQQALGVKLTIADLFAHPTVADLAAHLAPEQGAPGGPAHDDAGAPSAPGPAQEGDRQQGPDADAGFELWNAQQGLWLQHQLGEGRAELNLPVWQYVHEEVDVPAFRTAIAFLTERHQALRLAFEDTEHGPRQKVLRDHVPEVPLIDLTEAADPAGEAERLIHRDNATPFDDLGTPPVRVRIYRLAAAHHCVHLTVHHIVADGTSMGILLRELLTTYQAVVAGEEPPLTPLPVTFEGFVRDRREWLAGPESAAMRDYWLGELRAPLPTLHVGDHDGPTEDVVNETLDFATGADLAAGLGRLAKELDVTLHVLLLSAFAAALRDVGGDDDIVVCVPFSGRDTKELEGMVGTFVNPLSVRLTMSGADTFGDLVRRAQRKSVGSYAHSRYPFARLVEQVGAAARTGRNPVFSCAFQFTDFLPPAYQTSQLDICLYGKPGDDGLALRFNYNSRRLTRSEVLDIQAGFLAVLRTALEDASVTLSGLAEPLRAARRERRSAPSRGRRLGSLRQRATDRAAR